MYPVGVYPRNSRRPRAVSEAPFSMALLKLCKLTLFIVVGLLAILALTSCGPKPSAATSGAAPAPTGPAVAQTPLNVFVPCGIIVPMHDALAAFSKAHPEIKVVPAYDNPVGLARRIVQNPASADVYLGPGPVEVDQLAEQKLVDKTTVVPFAQLEARHPRPQGQPGRHQDAGGPRQGLHLRLPRPEV